MAVKESVTIRCDGDGCMVYADVEDRSRRPDGWYHVKKPTVDGKLNPAEGFDLCSLRCVEKWAKARAVALGETTNGTGRTYAKTKECPVCHEMFAPQGFHHHLRTTHPAYQEDA